VFADFKDFTQWIKPKLDDAFKMHLADLTRGIA
jgi:hypothetical protein